MHRPLLHALGIAFLTLILVILIADGSLAQNPPITGKAEPTFAPVDKAVLEFSKMIECQAATVAVSRDGELLYSRGFGWSDAVRKQPTMPDTIMRISGATMPFTAALAKMLIREDKLTLDAKAFDYLKIKPLPDAKPDSRLEQITIEHLLEHRGGWDRDTSFDPMYKVRQIEEFMRLRRPAQPADIVRFMTGQPLQFYPGEKKVISTFGYCVLGRVIEKASGKPYRTYLQSELLDRLELKEVKFARNASKGRDAREVWYPPQEVDVEIMDSSAGLVATAPALCKFLQHYWANGELREVGQTGEMAAWGCFPGTTALMRQHPSGYNVAVLCNRSRTETYKADCEQLIYLVDEAISKTEKAAEK